eukprot:scaffold263899_cov25-Prasinocladus_malaysianus.AAC.1
MKSLSGRLINERLSESVSIVSSADAAMTCYNVQHPQEDISDPADNTAKHVMLLDIGASGCQLLFCVELILFLHLRKNGETIRQLSHVFFAPLQAIHFPRVPSIGCPLESLCSGCRAPPQIALG